MVYFIIGLILAVSGTMIIILSVKFIFKRQKLVKMQNRVLESNVKPIKMFGEDI